MLRTLLSAILVLGLAAPLLPSDVAAGQGPPMNRIYAHDEIYTGVNAPRDLPNQGKFDAIYVLGPGMMPVSETAPGDTDYNGGRWEVRVVTFTGMSPTQFTNAEQIEQAHAAGTIALSDVVRRFECPLIPRR
jgi:hypothetical protein